jgi:sulfide:quinone oxidoreductase
MRVLELAPDVYVTGQLFEDTVRAAARQGVKTIINNRPDHEAPDQPLTADLQKLAEELGMSFVYQPVVSGRMTAQDVEDFRGIYTDIEKPLLIFCRTGARSTQLFEASGVE